MSALTGVRVADTMATIKANEAQISLLSSEIYKYCAGPEMEIRELTMFLTSGNIKIWSLEKLETETNRLKKLEAQVETDRKPREKQIDQLYQTNVTLKNQIKTQVIEDIADSTETPTAVASMIYGYYGPDPIFA